MPQYSFLFGESHLDAISSSLVLFILVIVLRVSPDLASILVPRKNTVPLIYSGSI